MSKKKWDIKKFIKFRSLKIAPFDGRFCAEVGGKQSLLMAKKWEKL